MKMTKKEPLQLLLDFSCESQNGIHAITSRIILEYLQLVLYQRSQIPEPVQIMQKKLHRERNPPNAAHFKQNKSKSRVGEMQYFSKCKQLLENLESLKSHISKLVEQCKEIDAVVTIGPTPISIKEAYSLKTKAADSPLNQETCEEQTVNAYARKFCMLMVQSSLGSGADLSLTNTRIFVRCRKGISKGLIPWPSFRYPDKKHCMSVQLNFHGALEPASELSNSFITSTRGLTLVASGKENIVQKSCTIQLPKVEDKVQPSSKSVSRCNEFEETKTSEKLDDNLTLNCKSSSKRCNRRLSVEEALDAVLAEDDVCSEPDDHKTEDRDSCSSQLSENEIMWFELPIVLKGFKF